MNRSILNYDVQQFIRKHSTDDVTSIALRKSPFPDVSAAELAAQIDGIQRCLSKLPLWGKTEGIYFPQRLNIEQASSQKTAIYKSRLIKGTRVADLTGGYGIDTFFLASQAGEVVYVEQNAVLSEIARHNLELLGASNIRFITSESLGFLQNNQDEFDTIYIDPARRKESRKVFRLKDTEPDVVTNLPLLLSRAARIIIKTSPLLDIHSGLEDLKNVSEVHIVSVKNECKEVLWVIDKDFTGQPVVTCAAIHDENAPAFTFSLDEEKETVITTFSEPQSFLYEPDVSLLKAGCFKLISARYKIEKLHPNTHLYTSVSRIPKFSGKIFRICSVTPYKDFSRQKKVQKANVVARNFPMSTDELRKKHKFKDGGNEWLFFTTGPSGNLLVIEAEKVSG